MKTPAHLEEKDWGKECRIITPVQWGTPALTFKEQAVNLDSWGESFGNVQMTNDK